MPIAWLPAAGAWSLFLWVLLALSTSGLPSPDLWWQLAGGRAVMAGAFPWTDTFSFTAYGLPWLNHEWLAEVGMYVAFQAGGLTLIHVVRIALLGLAFVTAAGVALVEGRRQWCAALAACLALANAEPSSFFDARPYLATYLGLPLVWLLVEWALRRDSIRPLYLLPPVFLVWANCHSGFVAGLGLLGVLTVVAPHEKRRHLALALVASVLAGLASPFGWHNLTFPFAFLGRHDVFTRHLNEWARPDLLGSQWTHLAYLLATVCAAALVRRRLTIRDGVVVASLAVLSVTAWRHIPLFALVCVPVWGAAFDAAADALHADAAGPVVGGLALAAGIWGVAVTLPRVDGRVLSRVDALFPTGATAFLEANPLPTRLYNAYGWGGWLLFHLPSRYQVFMDGRANTLYPAPVYQDFLDVFFARTDWAKRLRDYDVDLVLVNDYETRSIRGVTIGDVILEAPGWRLIYSDDLSEIYARKGARLPDPLRYPTLPPLEGAVDRAVWLVEQGRLAAAHRLLDQVLRQQPQRARAWLILGLVVTREGDPRRGEAHVREALKRDPRLPEAHFNLGALLLARGDRAGALKELDRELEVNPGSARALQARKGLRGD